jgi:hypothetical protein
MKQFIAVLTLAVVLAVPVYGQSSMRRCTLLPITDSVGGAIGYKVYEEVERELRRSSWCTFVSNAALVSVFSRYRENLPQYLRSKEVLATVADKLKVGSLILVNLKSELRGIEAELTVYGETGEDIYFSERAQLDNDDVELVAQTVGNWLDVYAKMIPYDAKISGILGDQITLDVGKGYPIRSGQRFVVKRLTQKKKHPLLKKVVDWETRPLAEGKVMSISDNQALGLVSAYKGEAKLERGDWVRLEEFRPGVDDGTPVEEKKEVESPGTLGIISLALFGANSSVDTTTPGGARRMAGNLFGVDFRVEGWITRQYFAALEIDRSLGLLKKSSGDPQKSAINVNNGSFKLSGGYKYLPIGFFYGPQIDLYGGFANHSFDLDVSLQDGFGASSISGILLGTAANVPLSREYRFFARAEFLPFPSFTDDDGIFGSATSVNAMELEIGFRYHYTVRMTLDGSVETLSRKARFKGDYKEISHKDNRLKLGVSFNF